MRIKRKLSGILAVIFLFSACLVHAEEAVRGYYSGGVWVKNQIFSDVTISEGKYTDCIAEVDGKLVDNRANFKISKIKCPTAETKITGTVLDADKVTGLEVVFKNVNGNRVAKNISGQSVYLIFHSIN